MPVVYTLRRQEDNGFSYLHGVFCGPFSAMRWADESVHAVRELKWQRIPRTAEWEAVTENDSWVIQKRQIWEY